MTFTPELTPADLPSKPLIVANWKMHGSRELCHAWVEAVTPLLSERFELVLAAPAVYIPLLQEIKPANLVLAAQDVSAHEQPGAYTGEITATMLRDQGVKYVIVGHSERRQYHGESDELIAQKACAAQNAGLIPVVCIGETEAQEQGGRHYHLSEQLVKVVDVLDVHKPVVVAYEPVWSIGTGKTPSESHISVTAGTIWDVLDGRGFDTKKWTRTLYGGSVNAGNVQAMLSAQGIEGCLVGGASVNPSSIEELLQSC